MPNLRRVGAEAEDRAANYLLEQGHTLVTRRFKGQRGEIDLVTLDGEILVITEVKWSRTAYRRAEEGVSPSKIAHLAAVTEEYLSKTGQHDRVVRFDVIAVDSTGLRHYRDAFQI